MRGRKVSDGSRRNTGPIGPLDWRKSFAFEAPLGIGTAVDLRGVGRNLQDDVLAAGLCFFTTC
jgi:hypothetical protein